MIVACCGRVVPYTGIEVSGSPNLPAFSSPLNGKVLVLGEDTRGFLASIRSFGRAGLSVHTAWCPLNSSALRSKYVSRNHQLPAYAHDNLQWLEAFCELLEREKFDLVLPCTDGIILSLQLHRDVVERCRGVHLLPDDVYWTCASKARTHALALSLGIPVPRQLPVSSLAELHESAVQLGFPLVLKPLSSSTAYDPMNRQNVVKARTPADLDGLGMKLLDESSPILVQQNVPGMGVGVEFLARDGVILTAFQHERVHEAPAGGLSGYRRSVPLDPGMYRAAGQLARALNYTGLAMVEFKQHPEKREWALIEINARVWGSLPLSIAAGIDFPRSLYEMLVLNRNEFPREYRENLYCRHWISDIDWLRANATADPNDPTLLVKSYSSIASELGNILSLRERSDTFQMDDPVPAFHELNQFFALKTLGLLKRFRFYRELKGRRAIQAFTRARNVLFVCFGNICRSPFAARRLQTLAPELTVVSAGVHLVPDRRSPAPAIEAAARFDVDLAGHRSAVLESAMVDRADVIFIFDYHNWNDMGRRFGGCESKVHFLGALDPGGTLEVNDPYGSAVEQFDYCYQRIDRALHALLSSAESD